MIAMLKGQMVLVREDYIVLDVNGVGYKVFVPAVPAGLPGQQLTLFTYLHVREDAMVLYGFVREEQLDMFELLISVSGMGPKGALGVLAHLDVDSIRRAVGTGDLGTLTGIPGVGKKTAQRLILELKDKLKVEDGLAPELIIDAAVPMDEALEALVALGYAPGEAKSAISKGLNGYSGEKSVETLIKMALKHIR